MYSYSGLYADIDRIKSQLLNLNRTKVIIYIKGIINYTWEIVGGAYIATFLEELEVSGNRLVRQW